MKHLKVVMAVSLALGLSVNAAFAAGATDMTPSCPKANIMGSSLFTSLCYNCFFPIRIAAAASGRNVPTGAASASCTCPGRLFGYPTTGPSYGMWYPDKIYETVRLPYCSPTLGTRISSTGSVGAGGEGFSYLMGGPNTGDEDPETVQAPYYNFHLFKFPIGQILDQMQQTICVSHTNVDADLMYISEIDPTWNNNALSLLTTPEAVLFTNPIANAACIADGAAATVWQPIELLFWCAGTWGGIYPLTGFSSYGGAPQQVASITNTRALVAMHRRLLAKQTKGDAAVCSAIPNPVFVKNQYKWQQMYPVPETISNHWTGESVWRWGQFRSIPAVGEDFVNVLWRWSDCCANL